MTFYTRWVYLADHSSWQGWRCPYQSSKRWQAHRKADRWEHAISVSLHPFVTTLVRKWLWQAYQWRKGKAKKETQEDPWKNIFPWPIKAHCFTLGRFGRARQYDKAVCQYDCSKGAGTIQKWDEVVQGECWASSNQTWYYCKQFLQLLQFWECWY